MGQEEPSPQAFLHISFFLFIVLLYFIKKKKKRNSFWSALAVFIITPHEVGGPERILLILNCQPTGEKKKDMYCKSDFGAHKGFYKNSAS